jgi:hypothetical protein
VASALLQRVLSGAERLGLGVAVDAAMDDEPARALYEKFGLRVVHTKTTSATDRKLLPVSGMVRLERPR